MPTFLETIQFDITERSGSLASLTQIVRIGPFTSLGPRDVRAVLQGFEAHYDTGHHVRELRVEVSSGSPIRLAPPDDKYFEVPITVLLGIRDSSSEFDDRYGGSVIVLVVASRLSRRKIALQTSDELHYVGAVGGGGGGVDAARTAIGAHEKFTLIDLDDDKVALQASGGQYVGASRGGGGGIDGIDAARTAIGSNEKFLLVPV